MTFYIKNRAEVHTVGFESFNRILEDAAMQSDIIIVDHGDSTVLAPATRKGKAWLRQNVAPEQQKYRDSIIVNTEAMFKIHANAVLDGLSVKVD